MRTRSIILLVTLLACGRPALAQIGVQLPGLPQAQVTLPRLPPPGAVLDRTVQTAAGAIDPRQLRTLRGLQVRDLLQQHRNVLERDPRGQPVLRLVLVALSPSDAALQAAQAAGFNVLQDRPLEAFGGRVVNLLAPRGLNTRRALEQLRRLDPQGTYDFNHVYLESAAAGATRAAAGPTPSATDLARTPLTAPPGTMSGASTTRVGLIDGGVEATHPAFATTRMHTFGCNGTVVPGTHGTAVASLLVGQAGNFHGAAPGFDLYAADVYCGGDAAVGGLVDWIVAALGWLAREHVPVVNVSLVGPPNQVLEGVVKLAQARGMVIVAAVGNDGPSAKPLYPAAYPGVVGVTAVDRQDRVLLEACRGPQVDFAAPGALMAAASKAGGYADVRGTSFAAPLVAGLIAATLAQPDPPPNVDAALQAIARNARDLGPRGPDTTYGQGLVGADLRAALVAATSTP